MQSQQLLTPMQKLGIGVTVGAALLALAWPWLVSLLASALWSLAALAIVVVVALIIDHVVHKWRQRRAAPLRLDPKAFSAAAARLNGDGVKPLNVLSLDGGGV